METRDFLAAVTPGEVYRRQMPPIVKHDWDNEPPRTTKEFRCARQSWPKCQPRNRQDVHSTGRHCHTHCP
jgi:hypothetical protein